MGDLISGLIRLAIILAFVTPWVRTALQRRMPPVRGRPSASGPRGFADILDGERLVATCLVVLAAPEGVYVRCTFKRRTVPRTVPPADFAADFAADFPADLSG